MFLIELTFQICPAYRAASRISTVGTMWPPSFREISQRDASIHVSGDGYILALLLIGRICRVGDVIGRKWRAHWGWKRLRRPVVLGLITS